MMTDRQTLSVIREQVDAVTATRVVGELTNDVSAHIEREFYYPYHYFKAQCRVPTLFDRKNVNLDCLVDAVSGLGATTDRFTTDERIVSNTALLSPEITAERAKRAARRALAHQLGRRLRMIAAIDIELELRGIVYKNFRLVRSRDALMMVDSMTGQMHPVRARAA